MIGIVLIGHNHIASEMKAAVEHVVGEQPLMKAMDVFKDADPATVMQSLQAMIQSCDVGEGVLLLADMFGGTPCNIAMGCFRAGHVEVISGFNLPLLIKAADLRCREKSLEALADTVLQSGRQYMCQASKVMVKPHQPEACRPASEDVSGG
ncbi:MAG TPA: PTS sugar transporter subunit IIA [Mariprofundaceae bacterium]|nr:PTS sugar transporter subunit IIA [Mariprofundaceae bacterium]